MSSNTKNLGLYKADPKVDGNQTFNIDTMLNENWDKIDEAVSNVSVPVQSVNNKTGEITLTSEDIKLKDGDSIEEFKAKTSTLMDNLTNDIANIQLVDTSVDIADPNNHFTATKLSEVLDELFQFASDGKTLISDVVGSPLLATDTFQQQKHKIQTLKNILASNLTDLDKSSTGNESLKLLVGKVGDITLGKKWASGSAVTTSTGLDKWEAKFSVSGLNFKPSIVLSQEVGGYYDFHIYLKNFNFNSAGKESLVLNASSSTAYWGEDSYFSVYTGGFTAYVLDWKSGHTYEWVAIE